MFKRMLSILLSLAILFCAVPLTASAQEEVSTHTPFVSPFIQLKEVPLGYKGIYTQADLASIPNEPDGSYILMNDIELTGEWTPLCSRDAFTGVLEGNGYTISGMQVKATVYRRGNYNLGLFAKIFGGRVANLRICGTIEIDSVFKSGYNSLGTLNIGGLVANLTGTSNIINCVSDVDMLLDTGSYGTQVLNENCGGLIGLCESIQHEITVKYCRFGGTMQPAGDCSCFRLSDVGGVIGYINARNGSVSVFGCHNLTDITCSGRLGGVIGGIQAYGTTGNAMIECCWNEGDLSKGYLSGGVVCLVEQENSGIVLISDCLNSGSVTAVDTIPMGGGIAAKAEALISNCVNVGDINTSCAITGSINEENNVKDCYFLDNMNTAYRWLNGSMAGAYTVTDGQLTAQQMLSQDAFPELSFPDIWIFAEGYSHPCPTCLINISAENAYKDQYIINTSALSEGSERFITIVGNSQGGLAGAMGDAYTQAQLDHVNGVWSAMEFIEGLLKAQVNLSGSNNEYYVLMSELLAGTLHEENYDACLRDSILACFSDLVTYLMPMMDAGQLMQCKEGMEILADMSKSTDEVDQAMSSIIGVLSKVGDWETLGSAFSALGSFVSLVEAEANFCKNYMDLINFYVLCNGYVNSIGNYGQVLIDTAKACYDGNTPDHAKIVATTEDLVADMNKMARDDPALLFRCTGGGIAELVLAGAAAVFDMKVQLANVNPTLAGIRAGVTLGMPLADSLTNMDSITYYGTMVNMAGNLAQGMHQVVLLRQDAFRTQRNYETAEALDCALDLYLNLQVQAIDYAIGYNDAIASAALGNMLKNNYDEIYAIYDLLKQKAMLEELLGSDSRVYVDEYGSITGFVAACPVTVTITGTDGTTAQLGTGSISYPEEFRGVLTLSGLEQERKCGRFDPSRYTAAFTGEADGTMNLMTYTIQGGNVGQIQTYWQLPVAADATRTLSPEGLLDADGSLIPASETTYLNFCFEDLPDGKYFTQPVLWAFSNGITTGTSATTFSPDDTCTRKQIVTFLWRAAGEPEPASMENPFTDVKSDRFEKAILWAFHEGITTGTSKTQFSPEATCTRKQIVTFLWRYRGEPEPASMENPFTDVKSDRFEKAILWAFHEGITTGKTATTFTPEADCTRGQIVTFLHRDSTQ